MQLHVDVYCAECLINELFESVSETTQQFQWTACFTLFMLGCGVSYQDSKLKMEKLKLEMFRLEMWKCSDWKCGNAQIGDAQIGDAQIGNIKLGNAEIGRTKWPSLATIEIGLLPYNSQRLAAPYL